MLTRPAFKTTAAILTALALFFWGCYEIANTRGFQLFGGLVSRVDTKEKLVALTFDDGPGIKTAEVLAILAEMQVKGTFFVIGEELERDTAAGRKIVAAGHELGNHTYSHQRMVFKSPGFIAGEIERTDRLIRDAGFAGEILFRPPYGKKFILAPYYLANHGRKTVLWDVEPNSIREIDAGAGRIIQHVVANVRPGSIILLHPMYAGREETIKAIPGIVRELRQAGYEFCTVGELLKHAE